MALNPLIDVSLGGSYLCPQYELRITKRCTGEDLDCSDQDAFEGLAKHEIIVAFINRRRNSPENTRQVTPLSTGKPVYRLAYGERHRGATWHDEANDVVWLLAYARHEFADAGDAFPYFKELDAAGNLLPTEEDYEALFLARDRRFADVVAHEAAQLVEAARASAGHEQHARIAGQLDVGVAIEAAENLEEIYVAVKLRGLTQENLPILLAAFFPQHAAQDLQNMTSIPGRLLEPDEVGYRVLVER